MEKERIGAVARSLLRDGARLGKDLRHTLLEGAREALRP
jgi:hypothetical protein